MSEKTAGSVMLLFLVVFVCALACANKAPKWCKAGSVESLFTDCERISMR